MPPAFGSGPLKQDRLRPTGNIPGFFLCDGGLSNADADGDNSEADDFASTASEGIEEHALAPGVVCISLDEGDDSSCESEGWESDGQQPGTVKLLDLYHCRQLQVQTFNYSNEFVLPLGSGPKGDCPALAASGTWFTENKDPLHNLETLEPEAQQVVTSVQLDQCCSSNNNKDGEISCKGFYLGPSSAIDAARVELVPSPKNSSDTHFRHASSAICISFESVLYNWGFIW